MVVFRSSLKSLIDKSVLSDVHCHIINANAIIVEFVVREMVAMYPIC